MRLLAFSSVKANLPRREALHGVISATDHLLRAALVTFTAWWLMRAYTTQIIKMVVAVVDPSQYYVYFAGLL